MMSDDFSVIFRNICIGFDTVGDVADFDMFLDISEN